MHITKNISRNLPWVLFVIVLLVPAIAWVQKNWRWVSLSQMIAMGLIFIHGLGVGQNINSGWLELYWIMLGLLLFSLLIVGKDDWKRGCTHT
jgi:hypothetical protein